MAWLHLPGAEQPGLCALEILPRIAACLGINFDDLTLRPLLPQAGGELAAGLNKAAALFEQEAAEPEAFASDAASLVSQWISYYGPVPREFTPQCLGLPAAVWATV
ncbi:MAG: hypothetical protein ABSC17_08325, partial [Thermacetogeniaceae bacterium]